MDDRSARPCRLRILRHEQRKRFCQNKWKKYRFIYDDVVNTVKSNILSQ